MLYFITGNTNKSEEARLILPQLIQKDLELPEIKELDPHKIIEAKLHEAFAHIIGEMVVEATSLFIEGLNGLPGPLVKWFLKTVSPQGIYNMTQSSGIYEAQARTLVGYATHSSSLHFFEGVIKGKIVEPRGESFGWDAIFVPVGYTQTFAEMGREEKSKISMRKIAFQKLKKFLN
jgi:non-canonical purine NTP pyrophosphatase (RdgB/HAM1 family)